MKSERDDLGGSYFALSRLLNRWRGDPAETSENSAGEAYLGSAAIFAISYLSAWQLFAGNMEVWSVVVVGILLVLVVSVFWLIVFYLNFVIVKVLRVLGVFRQTSNRDAQNILIAIILTALAMQLSILHNWIRWIGILFLAVLAANVVAAAILALSRRNT
jgi:hypothetical protein